MVCKHANLAGLVAFLFFTFFNNISKYIDYFYICQDALFNQPNFLNEIFSLNHLIKMIPKIYQRIMLTSNIIF